MNWRTVKISKKEKAWVENVFVVFNSVWNKCPVPRIHPVCCSNCYKAMCHILPEVCLLSTRTKCNLMWLCWNHIGIIFQNFKSNVSPVVRLFCSYLPCMHVFIVHPSFFPPMENIQTAFWQIILGVNVQHRLENNHMRKVKKHSSVWNPDCGG